MLKFDQIKAAVRKVVLADYPEADEEWTPDDWEASYHLVIGVLKVLQTPSPSPVKLGQLTAPELFARVQELETAALAIEPLEKFYVTYGSDTWQGNHYSVVEAPSYRAAREIIHQVTKGAFAFCYRAEEFAGQAEMYHLTQIPLTAQQKRA